VLQSNAESNHTEVELLRDKNTKFIASIARHQETISKLQEVGLVCQSVVLKFLFIAPIFYATAKNAVVIPTHMYNKCQLLQTNHVMLCVTLIVL